MKFNNYLLFLIFNGIEFSAVTAESGEIMAIKKKLYKIKCRNRER